MVMVRRSWFVEGDETGVRKCREEEEDRGDSHAGGHDCGNAGRWGYKKPLHHRVVWSGEPER